MSGHTPGKWLVGPECDNGEIEVISDARPYICAVFPGAIEGMTQANARLIAAAPELLEAANLMRAALQKYGDWDDGCFYYNGKSASELQSPIASLGAAIAKATGGAE